MAARPAPQFSQGGAFFSSELSRYIAGSTSQSGILAQKGKNDSSDSCPYLAFCAIDSRFSQVKAGTKGLSVTGDITVNGVDMSRSFFLENAAYVPQEDRLWSALTGVYVWA